MRQATQFDQVSDERIAALHGRRDPSRLRWRVWTEQWRRGGVPCFATDERNLCEDTDCPWRPQCLARKAEWRR